MADNQLTINPAAKKNDAPPAEKKPFKLAWPKLSGNVKFSMSGFDLSRNIKYIYPLTITVIIAVLCWVMYFLYNNVYLTMAQAELVSGLKTKVIEASVNLDRFNAVVKRINNMDQLANWPYLDYLVSPFDYGVRIPYPATTTSVPALSATSTLPATTASTTASMTESFNTKPTSTAR